MKIGKPFVLRQVCTLVVLFAVFGWPLAASAYESKTNRANSVTVGVRPLLLAPGQPAEFEVRMNTHSVDLSQDMVAVTTLKDDEEREYRATKWEGSAPGGHHRSGVLHFPNLEGSPKSLTLIIREIGDGPERIFNWNLKP